ncbi:MAG: sigma-E factor negative regulatory protein [Gammaproteobacteria bacterium]|nr:sigma-E factor negative regulatory protein [Gammaproteobacteria bacterium]
MSEQIREQISALLDGELPAAEQPLLLERLARDPALRAHWSTYQLIGDSLRKALPARIDLNLAERVRNEIDALPAQHAGLSSAARRALKPLAGLAVAASVAVVVVLAVQQVRTPAPGVVQMAANPPVSGVSGVSGVPGTSGVPRAYVQVQDTRGAVPRGDVPSPQVGKRLNEYLVNHSEYAASGGMPGMQPYVRIVGYDQE